ncbi:hypothetical protein DIPPA_21050 [Diplonema papillatum]|nr:hypothetical protein DIPPA_21050 [Diplonema papillatum]
MVQQTSHRLVRVKDVLRDGGDQVYNKELSKLAIHISEEDTFVCSYQPRPAVSPLWQDEDCSEASDPFSVASDTETALQYMW